MSNTRLRSKVKHEKNENKLSKYIDTLFSTPSLPRKLLPPGKLMSAEGIESLLREVLNSPIAFANSTNPPF